MAVIRHPLRGVAICEIDGDDWRDRTLTPDEIATAEALYREGYKRWQVAQLLMCHPLKINSDGAPPPRETRRPRGSNLPLRDAIHDPRQIAMEDYVEDFFDDLFGGGAES